MKLIVSSPPHWHGKAAISKLYGNLFFALLPAAIFAILRYGLSAARVMALSILTAVVSELFIRKLFGKSIPVSDGSAFYIGLLFALLLPPTVPFWMVILGTFLCVFVGREIFGGLGSNPLNPVLVGWAILKISWPAYLDFNLVFAGYELDFTFRYPLSLLKKGGAGAVSEMNLLDLFLGNQVGGLGAVFVVLLLVGGLYLVLRRIVAWQIPLFFLVGVLVTSAVFWLADRVTFANPIFHLVTGSVMIGAFFLATDYASAPFRKWGRVVFGLGCGVLTVILRVWSVYPDGVVFAILIMSLFAPLLDKIKRPPRALEIKYLARRIP